MVAAVSDKKVAVVVVAVMVAAVSNKRWQRAR